jgi:hypothetical protein
MSKLFVSLALSIGAIVIATSSVGALSSPSTGSATLHPIDRSGIKARMDFLDTHDDDTGLIISGTATGLDPGKIYISLLHDNDSVPGGPRACEISRDTFDEEQMFIGRWEVNADGTGTMFSIQFHGGYIPLSDIGTVSIREFTIPGRPDLAPVVACGQINKHK